MSDSIERLILACRNAQILIGWGWSPVVAGLQGGLVTGVRWGAVRSPHRWAQRAAPQQCITQPAIHLPVQNRTDRISSRDQQRFVLSIGLSVTRQHSSEIKSI